LVDRRFASSPGEHEQDHRSAYDAAYDPLHVCPPRATAASSRCDHTFMASPTPQQKAARTAKWATIMTKWAARFATGARRGAKATVKRWQFVQFAGPAGAESTGIVDVVALRRDHRPSPGFARGDLFEIIFIQVKGGAAAWPSPRDIERLRAVARRYRARDTVLASWTKGAAPEFFRLRSRRGSDPWVLADPRELFR
jgi:hypothetical protein